MHLFGLRLWIFLKRSPTIQTLTYLDSSQLEIPMSSARPEPRRVPRYLLAIVLVSGKVLHQMKQLVGPPRVCWRCFLMGVTLSIRTLIK